MAKTFDEEMNDIFLEDDTVLQEEAQEELQNNVGEQISQSERPVPNDEKVSTNDIAQPIEKVIPPEFIYAIKRIERSENDVNNVMSNCNDIERTIMPTLKKGIHIRENFEREIADRGERALLYYQADIISSFSSTFSTIDGYIKNIKFSMGRIQDDLDDIKKKIKQED